MRKRSVIIKKIHVMIARRTTPDGRIDRKKLFEVMAERIGRIQEEDRHALVRELKDHGLILDSDRFSFQIAKEI